MVLQNFTDEKKGGKTNVFVIKNEVETVLGKKIFETLKHCGMSKQGSKRVSGEWAKKIAGEVKAGEAAGENLSDFRLCLFG